MGGMDRVVRIGRWALVVVVLLGAGGCSRLADGMNDAGYWSAADLPVHTIALDAGLVACALGYLVRLAAAAFLLWLWRKHGIRGALWLALYLLTPMAMGWETPEFAGYLRSLPKEHVGAFGLYEVDLLILDNAAFALAGALGFACAATIASAECVHVLATRLGQPTPRILGWLAGAWTHMRAIGITMLLVLQAPIVATHALRLTGS